jgi:regulator of protease activity HflC (stomatin/prohibitin superfamily)
MSDRALDGPVAQSIRIGFRVLQLATVLLAIGWAASNIRQIPPHLQAVVLRFGQVVRVQQAGLLVVWPRPVDEVVLVPGASRQLELRIDAASVAGKAIVDPVSRDAGEIPPATAGVYLTGTGGVVLLDATLTYRINDAAAYYQAATHVEPALRRLFLASAVTIAAGHSIDDFIVVRGREHGIDDAGKQAVRGAIVQDINRRLGGLGNLGVEATRADVTALLPPSAKFAFDAVLDAAQMADQGLAAARTDATRNQQAAQQESDRIRAGAHASADEQVRAAIAHVAAITALRQRASPASRPSLLDQTYRERIAGILKQAGAVNTVDTQGGSRLILPGVEP